MKNTKNYTRLQRVIDKQTNRAAIVIAVCFVAAWCLDSIEQGAGTLPILIAVSYAGVTFYRGVKLLTHKSYTDDKRDL